MDVLGAIEMVQSEPCLAQRTCTCRPDTPEGAYDIDCVGCRRWHARHERMWRENGRRPQPDPRPSGRFDALRASGGTMRGVVCENRRPWWVRLLVWLTD